MDINTKTQLTNSFSKGMNTDLSDAVLGNDQYRLANNLRFVTNTDENTGELHLIEGSDERLNYTTGTYLIIAADSIRDYGVLVGKNTTSWAVFYFNKNVTIGTSANPNQIAISKVVEISNTICNLGDTVSLVTKYEDEDNIKVYIADGEHPVSVVNIKGTYDNNDYQKITSYPKFDPIAPTFVNICSGSIGAAVVLYCYQLYNIHGQITEMSTPTKMIFLRRAYGTSMRGVESGKRSMCGVTVQVTFGDPNNKYDAIKLYRISYIEAGQLPTISLVTDKKLTAAEKSGGLTILDVGQEGEEVLTLEEFNSMSGIHIIPSVIESKDDYMFAAKIQTKQSQVDDIIKGAIANAIKAPLTETGVDFYDMQNIAIPESAYKSGSSWKLYSSERQISNQDLIQWKLCTTNIVVDSHATSSLLTDGINTGYKDISNVYNYPSLRRNEMYRFGIIFYTEDGTQSSVFWIADIRTPNLQVSPPFTLSGSNLTAVSLGVDFKIFDDRILDALDAYTTSFEEDRIVIRGYEIVRAVRTESDVCSISQGVVARPGRRYNTNEGDVDNNFPLSPTGWLTTADFTVTHDGRLHDPNLTGTLYTDDGHGEWLYTNTGCFTNCYRNDRYFQFVSPEVCYQSESIFDLALNSALALVPFKYTYNSVQHSTPVDFNFTDTQADSTNNTIYNFVNNNPSVSVSITYGLNEYTGGYCAFGNDYTQLGYINDGTFKIHYPSTASLILYRRSISSSGNSGEVIGSDIISAYDKNDNTYLYVKLYTFLDATYGGGNGAAFAQNVLGKADIQNVQNVSALQWKDVSDYRDKVVSIGSASYVNWVATNLFGMPIEWNGVEGNGYHLSNATLESSHTVAYGGVQGPAGKCMLLDIRNNTLYPLTGSSFDVSNSALVPQSLFGTFLCDLRKTNTTPYGMAPTATAPTESSLTNTTYYSYGCYYKMDTSVTTGISRNIFIGDTFIQPFEYVSLHKYYHNRIKYPRNACVVYSIPVESSINVAFSYGYEFSKNDAPVNIQDQPGDVYGSFVQETPMYEYNGAYSSNSKAKIYAAYQDDPSNIKNEDYRCYHSQPKANNEKQDNWLIYRPANFLDVDTRMGPITGLRRFHNNLVFWQEMATGLFSVNERTTITDDSNLPLMLGTGGILARYDYINTSNGMHEGEFADAQSDSTLYWWDHNKWELCAYAGGQESVVLSKVKGVQNFLNKQREADKGVAKPLLTFDKRYNELISHVTDGAGKEAGSLVYSELLQAFTSLYTIQPDKSITFADSTYFVKNTQTGYGLHKWNTVWYVGSENPEISLYVPNTSVSMGNRLYPYLKYVVNDNTPFVKVFDNVVFGGRFYKGNYLECLNFTFKTPLKQESRIECIVGEAATDREYDFRFAVPRAGKEVNDQWVTEPYGDRMRGKTMQCELESTSNDLDFSLQYITTKYRISWS